jgi:hypothetical protein
MTIGCGQNGFDAALQRKGSSTTMKSETPEEIEARGFFEFRGYIVTRIPEARDGQRADYSLKDGTDRYIVEVKSRGPDQDFASQLERGARAESKQPMGRTNTISRQVKEASDQLAATDPDDLSALRLIVFVAAGDDPELQVEQFKRTLYGIVDLLRQEASEAIATPCFYFTFNEFFRFPHVDGALVLFPMGAQKTDVHLYANGYSCRSDRLRASKLYQQLALSGAVTDPVMLERAGKAFVADTDLDRRNEGAVLSYIRNKYGQPELLDVRFKKLRVAVKVSYESRGSDSP